MQRLLIVVMMAIGVAGLGGASAGAGSRAEPATTRHLTVAASAPEAPVAPGARVSLVLEVVPKPGMHVYAPGQKDLIPVTLTLAANRAVAAGRVRFPAAEKLEVPSLGETQRVYSKPFRIVQAVTLGKSLPARDRTLTIDGTLKYQACDERICYAPVTVPVSWTLTLKRQPPR